jgi:hypothetical protein
MSRFNFKMSCDIQSLNLEIRECAIICHHIVSSQRLYVLHTLSHFIRVPGFLILFFFVKYTTGSCKTICDICTKMLHLLVSSACIVTVSIAPKLHVHFLVSVALLRVKSRLLVLHGSLSKYIPHQNLHTSP